MHPATLTDIIKFKASLSEEGICFIEGTEQEIFLSYNQLYTSSLKVLRFLQERGLQPKDELVFQIDDNQTFILVFWACILGGIIPVPVAIGRNDDHKLKLFNVWQVLRRPWLIADRRQLGILQAFSGTKDLIRVFHALEERLVPLEETLSADTPGEVFPSDQDDIAFVQFSSGSTGNPKGVCLTHRNLITNMAAITHGGAYTTADSFISWMPLTHDMGLIGFHLNPLFCGLSHYIIPTSLFVRRPAIWLDKVTEHKVTVLCSPNFGYHYILKHCLGENKSPAAWDLTHVRLIYNGAEPISATLCEKFLSKMVPYGLKRTSMCPVYGLAEATLAVSISGLEDEVKALHLDRGLLGVGDTIREGDPMGNTVSFVNVGSKVMHCGIRITNQQGMPIGNNVVGHIEIKGQNVTAGYYNYPEATRAVLTEDGWLHTGDLGFIQNDSLYITGRRKDIVFVNGQNFYPHDIERVGEEVQGIELNKIAVGACFNHLTGRDELLAFVFHRGKPDSFIPLVKALQKRVNLRMGLMFDQIIPVKTIPKTTSGKIQRFKLLQAYESNNYAEEIQAIQQLLDEEESRTSLNALREPTTSIEQQLLELWKRVLSLKHISVQDSFFELGGNSLKAAELGMLIQKVFQLDFSPELLYEFPSIRELSNQLPLLSAKNYESIILATEREWYPVSFSQKRLLYHWHLNPGSLSYHVPVAMEITGPLDLSRLEESFICLIRRHDALRLRFRLQEQAVFTVDENVQFKLEVKSCGEDDFHSLLHSQRKPFDLSQGSPLRVWVFQLKPEKHILFMDMHHIITDGVSVYHLLNELWQLYADQPLTSIDIIASFRNYVEWEQNTDQSHAYSLHKKYWEKQLSGDLPVLNLPADFQRPQFFQDQGEKIRFELSTSQSQGLREFAKTYQCSLHTLLFTLYYLLLSKYSGQREIIIGIPVTHRPHPDLQETQGMFVNNLPIWVRQISPTSFLALTQQIQSLIAEGWKHRNFPFDHMLEMVKEQRDVSRNPVFDTMFIYQNMGWPQVKDAAIHSSPYFFDPRISKYDLSMEVMDHGDALVFALEYASSLFMRETITRMGSHFQNLISLVLTTPEVAVTNLSILSKEEYKQVITDFNDTEAAVPEKAIHHLFEEQVRRTPDNTAIEYGEQQITYSVLNDKAERLAVLLKRKGLKAGGTAGIVMGRCPELIAGILAILKCGACYVPVDVELPEERIKYILKDCKADVILTEKQYLYLIDPQSNQSEQPEHSLVYVRNQEMEEVKPISQPTLSDSESLAYILYTSGTTGKPKV